ncbi:MAG: response regulator [Desulfobacterales bacterium]|nr:response regulator [Desulfobacterales bacterium]
MSHEIRTPMNAVLGFTELLNSMVTDKVQKNYIESIRSSGKSLLTLINDILDLSKIEARKLELQYEPVNPKSIFNEIRNVFSLKIVEKGIDFIVNIDQEIPDSLLLDEVRLRQILFNLFGNAVKFTEKGYIKLCAEKIYTHQDDKSTLDLIIAVEDTGIGIPPESADKIFDAFKQQDGQSTKEFGGTGLGLAITKRLVEMMGGEISVKSAVGKGSRFEIVFHDVSVAATRPISETKKKFDDENIVFEKAVILVVDDIETNRDLVKGFFKNTEITVIEAEDGMKSIMMAKQHKPDVILMDLRMPIMNGYEATSQIRNDEELKNIPVIALTASGMKEDKEKSKQSGFDAFLTKPVQRSDLFRELSNYMKHSKTEQIFVKPEQREKTSDISSEILEKLPEIVDRLENEYMVLWKSASETGFFDNIEEFARQIKEFGEECLLEILQQYGNDLSIQVSSFDIENINVMLDSYPGLVKKIRHISLAKSLA